MAFVGSISGSSGTGNTPVTGALVVTSSGGVTTLTISSDGYLSSSLPFKGNAEGLSGIPSQLETTASFDVTHELTASRTMFVTASTVFISGSPSAGGVGTGSFQVTGSTVMHGQVTGTLIASGTHAGPGSFLAISTLGGFVLATPGGAVTGVNNKSENRLVSIGSTTTELDGEANLTFDGDTLTVAGAVTGSGAVSGHSLAIQAGAVITGSSTHHGALTLENGTLSSSGGATFLGSIFAEDVNVSGTLTAATFSPTSVSGNVAININKPLFANGLNVSGTSVYADDISSSAGATFLGTVIANTIEASSSIFAGGHMEVTGNISSSAILKGQQLAIQEGFQVTGSSIIHGGLTHVNGTLSSSGDVLIGGSLSLTNPIGLETTGSIQIGGLVSGSEGLSIGGVATFTNAASIVASGTISSSGGAVFLGDLYTTDLLISGNVMMTQVAPDDLGDNTNAVTISNMLKGISTVTPTENRTKNTDTAANIVGGLTNPEPNTSFEFIILNAATGPDKDITLNAASGVTIVGNAAIRSEDSVKFRVRVTNVGSPAVSIYRV